MANKENHPPTLSPLSSISPGNKPALNRQRDHSACRRPETPLRVRKTRDNLKQSSIYADIPPPCVHNHEPNAACIHDASSVSNHIAVTKHLQTSSIAFEELAQVERLYSSAISQSAPASAQIHPQRRRSVKQRMLVRVKQGITNRSKNVQGTESSESSGRLLRRFSGRRNKSTETSLRAQSFEISRDSIDSLEDDSLESTDPSTIIDGSFSGTSVLTADVFGDSIVTTDSGPLLESSCDPAQEPGISLNSQTPSSRPSRSPEPTPRAAPRVYPPPLARHTASAVEITVPYVELDVQMDLTTLDVHHKAEMWIAIKATVRMCRITVALHYAASLSGGCYDEATTANPKPSGNDSNPTSVLGSIASLRLCYKPIGWSRIRAVIGQKAIRDLVNDQEVLLFVKLRIPRLNGRDSGPSTDVDSLFMELESMMGTLETEIMHVEARYRNSSLPVSNVLSVRHTCILKRPRTASRWSIITLNDIEDRSMTVQTMLAEYLADHYSNEQALKLMDEHLDSCVLNRAKVFELRARLAAHAQREPSVIVDDDKPSVIVTDIDESPAHLHPEADDKFSTAPSTPLGNDLGPSPWLSPTSRTRMPSSTLPISGTLALPLIAAPKAKPVVSRHIQPLVSPIDLQSISPDHSAQTQDTAHQLWRHLRRTSLSTKQLEDTAPTSIEHIEAGDNTLRELRCRALANKRSIGAETLKDWKWEENLQSRRPEGEAPWM